MTLTRNQAKAREAGCRVTIDRPSVSRNTSVSIWEHRWDCTCVYRWAQYADGTISRLPSTHCTEWGE